MVKKKLAFTLAEDLITLGIIGAVAAMTLPTIYGAVEERIFENRTKHAVSLISNAATTYMANNQLYSLASVRNCKSERYKGTNYCTKQLGPNLQQMIESTLKIARKCDNVEDCYTSTFMMPDGSSKKTEETILGESTYELLDGYILNIKRMNDTFDNDYIEIWLDINGKDDPNTLGEDLWYFALDKVGAPTTHYSGGIHYRNENGIEIGYEDNNSESRNCDDSLLNQDYSKYFCEFQRDKMNINRK